MNFVERNIRQEVEIALEVVPELRARDNHGNQAHTDNFFTRYSSQHQAIAEKLNSYNQTLVFIDYAHRVSLTGSLDLNNTINVQEGFIVLDLDNLPKFYWKRKISAIVRKEFNHRRSSVLRRTPTPPTTEQQQPPSIAEVSFSSELQHNQ
ncbi:hypothetical protein RND71_008262 [Anisodus tanguticus]|uniref:Uncharacterized protein n=1 Tax=Anisodus tanguticus TaxID=243964 RepID=A0AAE1VJT7_9SOLA|nr:hypothetical protein RND71_008262 [Anisodus tanguticus]